MGDKCRAAVVEGSLVAWKANYVRDLLMILRNSCASSNDFASPPLSACFGISSTPSTLPRCATKENEKETMGEDEPKPKENLKCILLYSSCCMDPIQDQDQRRCRDLLKGKGVPYEQIDGSEGSTQVLRNTLWTVSGQRGKYPQVFIERDGEHEFVGLWSDVEGMNECEALPPEILEANPEIKTFKAVFGDLVVERGPPRPPGG